MRTYHYGKARLKNVPLPKCDNSGVPVFLTDETMNARKNKVLERMKRYQLDVIIVYGDLEHGSNFEYLTGFLPRFEESLLVLHQDERAYLLLGNENTKMANYTRLPAELIHAPYFSLPNQPMTGELPFTEYFKQAGVKAGQRVGIVGWKYFTSRMADNRKLFDIPYYIVESIKEAAGGEVFNVTGLFIGGEEGARITNNANEIAHYEFGSSLASDGVLNAMNALAPGKTEMELAGLLNLYGQPNSVVTICAAGDRFYKANLYPGNKQVALGDRISITVGYKGGLSSRAGYAVYRQEELPEENRDYMKKLAAPYFTAITAWLECIRIGMEGDGLYRIIEQVLPKAQYHWSLNPGHLTADEEWMSSPIFPGSTQKLKSGMLLQLDIIPSMPGYGGIGAENGIALADQALQKELETEYPDLWKRIQDRKAYLKEQLGIHLGRDVLPLSSTVAYLRPYLLNKKEALAYID